MQVSSHITLTVMIELSNEEVEEIRRAASVNGGTKPDGAWTHLQKKMGYVADVVHNELRGIRELDQPG